MVSACVSAVSDSSVCLRSLRKTIITGIIILIIIITIIQEIGVGVICSFNWSNISGVSEDLLHNRHKVEPPHDMMQWLPFYITIMFGFIYLFYYYIYVLWIVYICGWNFLKSENNYLFCCREQFNENLPVITNYLKVVDKWVSYSLMNSTFLSWK